MRLRERDDPLGLPEACFLFGHLFLVFDHYTDRISLLGLNYRDHRDRSARAVEETVARIGDLDFNFLDRAPASAARPACWSARGSGRSSWPGCAGSGSRSWRGTSCRGCSPGALEVQTGLPALEAYRSLRSANPSPYLFYLDFDRFQLFGASPEVHVKVRRGKATMRPIAGTRRRGGGEEEDLRLEKELLTDEKERAEHLMLVDLARNDLGRVCRPGTVRVTESMAVERYSHVMHLVSQVEGELEEGRTGLDALRATFPAGTVSGAPKIRAIEVIDGLEPQRRGFYAGVVGYLEPDGGLDTCIAIRSAVRIGDRLVLQAGAGVVYDSDPEREYEETQSKLRALALAAGVEEVR